VQSLSVERTAESGGGRLKVFYSEGRTAVHPSAGGIGGLPATPAAAAAGAHAARGGELQSLATPFAFTFAAGSSPPGEGTAKRRRGGIPLPLPPPGFPPLRLAPAPKPAAAVDGSEEAAGGVADERLSPPDEGELPNA